VDVREDRGDRLRFSHRHRRADEPGGGAGCGTEVALVGAAHVGVASTIGVVVSRGVVLVMSPVIRRGVVLVTVVNLVSLSSLLRAGS